MRSSSPSLSKSAASTPMPAFAFPCSLSATPASGPVSVNVPVEVMPDEQIQRPVTIEVKERGGHAPSRVVDTARVRHVGERAVAAVAKQLIASERGHVQVGTSVVVEVAGGDAHAVTARD